jgi:hypothetical protein
VSGVDGSPTSPRTFVATTKRGHVAAFGEGRPLERTRAWEEPQQLRGELDQARPLSRMEGRAAGTAAAIDAGGRLVSALVWVVGGASRATWTGPDGTFGSLIRKTG